MWRLQYILVVEYPGLLLVQRSVDLIDPVR
jgi:hypothetical protein